MAIPDKKDNKLIATRSPESKPLVGPEISAIVSPRRTGWPSLINARKTILEFKVLKTSGAYWKGDPSREMITRVYATSFPDRKLLKDYLTLLEEAKKRDHKILGPKLDLFSLKEEAPGIIFYGTPSHGGYWLSPERRLQLNWNQNWLSSAEWWGEDCDWAIPYLFFATDIKAHGPAYHFEENLEIAKRIAKTHHPEFQTP